MNKKLFIFDLDGTILNTLTDLLNSVNFALQKNNLPQRTKSEVNSFVGNGIRKLIERSVPKGAYSEQTDKVFDDFCAHYSLHCADSTKPYSGIPELLAFIHGRNAKIAVVSNKADSAVKKLCRLYFGDAIDMAVGERDGIKRKPSPDSVNEVMAHFGISENETVYIGDSDVDIETARNAGVDCISVCWGFRSREFLEKSGGTVFAQTPEMLFEIIKNNY